MEGISLDLSGNGEVSREIVGSTIEVKCSTLCQSKYIVIISLGVNSLSRGAGHGASVHH